MEFAVLKATWKLKLILYINLSILPSWNNLKDFFIIYFYNFYIHL